MMALILACILAFTIVRSQTMELIDQVVEENWEELKEYLNEQKVLLIDDMRLSEKSRQKILSLELPKLKELHFQKYQQFSSTYRQPYDWHVSVTAETLKTVFMSNYFPRLDVLNLLKTNIDDRSLEFLDQTSLKTSIKSLNLQGLYLGAKGFERLSRVNFTNLKILNIKNCLLSRNQSVNSLISMICGSETQKCKNNLISLNIQSTNIGRQGFINLFSRLNSSSLRHLTINELSMVFHKTYKEGFNYSAYEFLSKHYLNLEVLDMKNSFIDDKIAEIFSQWKLNNLVTLDVEDNFLTDVGVTKWITKKNMPKLTNIFIKSNQVGDGTIHHFIQEGIQFKQLSFGDCLITKEGFEQFVYLDFTQLQKLIIYGNINTDTLQQLALQDSFQELKFLSIQKSKYIQNLFIQIDWSFLPKIENIVISNCDLKGFYSNTISFMFGVQISSSLKSLALFETQITLDSLQYFIYSLSNLFPSLQSLIILEEQSNLFVIPSMLQQATINEGTYLNINMMSYQKENGKFKVLFLTEIFFLVVSQQNPSYEEFIARIDGATKIFELGQLEGIFISGRQAFDIFFRFMETTQIKSLPKLKFFQYGAETDIEFLISYLEEVQMPSLKLFFFSFIFPGDLQESFIQSRLIPYLQRFKNLQTFSLNMIFLNEQRSFIQRQQVLQNLNYPRLKELIMPDQNMEVQQIQSFIKKHSKTVRLLDLSNNFLQNGFLQILVDYQFILSQLSLSTTSFTVEQFSIFGDLSFDYMRALLLNQNDLTDEHISYLIGQKQKSFLKFPKLGALYLQHNDIRSQGLISLFQTGLYQISQLDVQGNSNPNFINIVLTFPSRIESLKALNVQIYGIQNDLEPLSARNIKAVQIRARSFISEDFHNLARLDFSRLFYIEMDIFNVYECQVLLSILKIAKDTRVLMFSISNDLEGLRSECLKDYKMQSKMELIAIADMYTTSYIPQFAALSLNTASVLNFIALENTRFSPSFFKKSLAPHFKEPLALYLDQNYFGDEAMKLLNTELDLNVYSLMLGYNNITDSSFLQINNPHLIQIRLDGNKLGPKALSNLKQSAIPNVVAISLSNCDLDGQSLGIISTFQFQALQQINLDNNNFSEDDMLKFASQLDRKRLPVLIMMSLKGLSLSKDYHKSISQVLTAKTISFQLDQPHNLLKQNSAKY